MVGADVCWVSVENLANGEYTGGTGEPGPEVLLHMLDCIEAKTIDLVGGDEVSNPALEDISNIRVLRFDIG